MIVLIFIVLTAILALVYNYLLNRPDLMSPLLEQYLLFLMLLAGSVVLVRAIGHLVIDILFTRLTGKAPSELLRLVVAIITFGVALILNLYFVLNANVAALLTTSALLTAILGFALQATLGNLFEGLSVQVHQPFNIGDWLEFGDDFGQIESLTWRAIAVRRTDNSVVSIPNNILAQRPIRVFAADDPIRIAIEFPAPIDTPPRRIVEIAAEAVADVDGVLPHRRPEVLLKRIAAAESALHYELRFYIYIDNSFDRVEARVRERVWYALARAGVPMPASIEGDTAAFKVPLLRSYEETLLPETTLSDVIAANPIFMALPEAVQADLSRRAIRLIFSPGEAIEREGERRFAMFIVLRGLVNVPLPMERRADDWRSRDIETYWEPEELEKVRDQFVEYVGPAAGYLVKQAAKQTIDPYHLYRILAEDIPNEAEREMFLALGPVTPAREIATGDFFGAMSLFTGQAGRTIAPKAVTESELLEINLPTMQQIITAHPDLVEIIAARLATYYTEPQADILTQMREFYGLTVKRGNGQG